MRTHRLSSTPETSMRGARTPESVEYERPAQPDPRAYDGPDRPTARRPDSTAAPPTAAPPSPSRIMIPRSRGALSGLVLVILGIWAGLIPFVGPYFHYAYINYHGFAWLTIGRLWLSIIPGVVAVLAGIELMRSANRPTATLAAICGAAAGAWLIIGPTVSTLWNHGVSQTGRPLGGTFLRMLVQIGYFYALGAIILFFAAMALGRLSMIAFRDVPTDRHRYSEAPRSRPAEPTV